MMSDNLHYAFAEELDEETLQAKIDALKPGESVAMSFRWAVDLQLAAWHAPINGRVVHVGFDIVCVSLVGKKESWSDYLAHHSKYVDLPIISLIIGDGKYAVFSNDRLTYYDSLKAVAKIYTSPELDLMRQKEKYREYRRHTDAIIADMQSQLACLWYSPGMPGAKEAGEHFASIKSDEEPFY